MLQATNSDVSLYIPEGSPGVYKLAVHTDLVSARSLVPEDECFVSPVIELDKMPLLTKQKQTDQLGVCELTIPHCQKEKHSGYMKLRHHHTDNNSQKSEEFHLVKEGSVIQAHGTFRVNKAHVQVYTNSFSKFTCTSCKKFSCQADILTLLFGNLSPTSEYQRTVADMELFLLSNLYQIKDFRQVGIKCYIAMFFIINACQVNQKACAYLNE